MGRGRRARGGRESKSVREREIKRAHVQEQLLLNLCLGAGREAGAVNPMGGGGGAGN